MVHPDRRRISRFPRFYRSTYYIGAGGDPHVKLWDGTTYSYHGECNLVLLENKDFHNGLGMDIHIRTTHKPYVTIPTLYSFIESVVIRIGTDVLELMGDSFWFNGVQGSDSDLPTTMAGFPLNAPTFTSSGRSKSYVLELNNDDKIVIRNYGEFMYVDIKVSVIAIAIDGSFFPQRQSTAHISSVLFYHFRARLRSIGALLLVC
jgi:hypothetical protein